jgi:hypothetical protein
MATTHAPTEAHTRWFFIARRACDGDATALQILGTTQTDRG